MSFEANVESPTVVSGKVLVDASQRLNCRFSDDDNGNNDANGDDDNDANDNDMYSSDLMLSSVTCDGIRITDLGSYLFANTSDQIAYV